jgi:hypothetical protein
MNSKVKTQTNKAKLEVCLRISLKSIGLISIYPCPASPGPYFVGGQVSRNRLGSIQIITRVTI